MTTSLGIGSLGSTPPRERGFRTSMQSTRSVGFRLPPPPTLLDVRINGKLTPIRAQGGKTGLIYILNCVTGEPIFGIKDTPVAQSQVPGEKSSPTQPIALKPPPIGRTAFAMSDLVTSEDTNEVHAKASRELVEKSGGMLYSAGLGLARAKCPPVSSIIPGPIADNDWGGLSLDSTFRQLQRVCRTRLNRKDAPWRPSRMRATKRLRGSRGAEVLGAQNHQKQLLGSQSWPCQNPPRGCLTAINAKTGDIVWQTTLGPYQSRRQCCNRGRTRLHPRHQRQPLRRLRSQDWQGTLSDETRLQCSFESHLIMAERTAKGTLPFRQRAAWGLTDTNPPNSESI